MVYTGVNGVHAVWVMAYSVKVIRSCHCSCVYKCIVYLGSKASSPDMSRYKNFMVIKIFIWGLRNTPRMGNQINLLLEVWKEGGVMCVCGGGRGSDFHTHCSSYIKFGIKRTFESKGCPSWRCCLWTIESIHIGQPFISWHVRYSHIGLYSLGNNKSVKKNNKIE